MQVPPWQRLLQANFPAMIAALVATVGISGLKSLTVLESWELRAYDQMMRAQPQPDQDSSILLVTITEADIQAQKTYPLPDTVLIAALEKLNAAAPKVIGLDLFRDLPIPDPFAPAAPNTISNNLSQYLIAHPNVIALCKVGRADNPGVAPPAGLRDAQVGFADLPLDFDGVVRRAVLIRTPTPDSPCSTPAALGFQLAQNYLSDRSEFDANEVLQLGTVRFPRVQPNMGGYHRVDARGYQILINFHPPASLGQQVTLTQLLNDQVPVAAIRNRVVLIGVTAESSNDKFMTPLDDVRAGDDRTPGVLIHAQVVQQILGAVNQGQSLIWAWPAWGEWLWVYGWSLATGVLWVSLYRKQGWLIPTVITGVGLVVLVGLSYGVFIALAGWLPVVPAGLGILATSVMLVIHQATRPQTASATLAPSTPAAPPSPAAPAPQAPAAAYLQTLVPDQPHSPHSRLGGYGPIPSSPGEEATFVPAPPSEPPTIIPTSLEPTLLPNPPGLEPTVLNLPPVTSPEPTVLQEPELPPPALPHPEATVLPAPLDPPESLEPPNPDLAANDPLPTMVYDTPASSIPPPTSTPIFPAAPPTAATEAPMTDISGLHPHNLDQAFTLKEPTTGPESTASSSHSDTFDAPSYSSELIPGLLAGRYKVITQLGHGGFGRTYLAEDTQMPLNPICVVKQLLPSRSDAKFLQLARRLFQREAATLAQVGQHDRIPRLLAYFEENKAFFLVQEYVKGQSLQDELLQTPVFEPNYVKQLLQEILAILVYVHGLNVVHRDIKPGNILRRDSDQQLVLIDFGAVRHIQPEDLANLDQKFTIAIGTRGYAPSEQMAGRPTFASDIYALGVVAIEALSGVSPADLQHNPTNGELIWQSQAPISPQFRAVLEKMVRYNFRQRYASAQDVLDDLAQA